MKHRTLITSLCALALIGARLTPSAASTAPPDHDSFESFQNQACPADFIITNTDPAPVLVVALHSQQSPEPNQIMKPKNNIPPTQAPVVVPESPSDTPPPVAVPPVVTPLAPSTEITTQVPIVPPSIPVVAAEATAVATMGGAVPLGQVSLPVAVFPVANRIMPQGGTLVRVKVKHPVSEAGMAYLPGQIFETSADRAEQLAHLVDVVKDTEEL